MTEFIFFLGRFHVLLLHLPIGILLLAVVLELFSRREGFGYLAPAVTFVWALGAIAAIGTVALGYMHASEGGFDSGAINAHRIAGTSLAVLACVTWLLRAKLGSVYAKAWPACSAAMVVLLFLTGHFGGNLTHGDTYLVQYAPGPLRQLVGASAESLPRPKPKDAASADIYLDVVAPALNQRCNTCHNDSKRKGGLSVASYAQLMKGGEKGPVIVARNSKGSDLVRRIELPADHKDFMPHDNKTPLTADQTAAIDWWVSVGAPKTATVASLHPAPEVRASLDRALGFAAPLVAQATEDAKPAMKASEPLPSVPPADATVVNTLESNGFVVRSIAAGSGLVQVDYTVSRQITDADVASLAKIGPQIYSLNVRNAGLNDAQLQTVAGFEHLAHLRVELNPITDAGLSKLASLKQLTYLNLYGTKVTNGGLKALAHFDKLQELYVWQTAVTAAGIADLKHARQDMLVDNGFDPKTFPEGPKVIPVVN